MWLVVCGVTHPHKCLIVQQITGLQWKNLSNEKQSRLELYVEVLKALGETQSLNMKAIQGRTQIDKQILIVAMKFLEQQNLVQLRNVGTNIEYQNTGRGVRVFKFLAPRNPASNNGVSSGVNLLSVQRSFE